jgi:Transposase IS116/IS110/IS902 family
VADIVGLYLAPSAGAVVLCVDETSGVQAPGRCRNDAAFAKLAGTSPIEASSGRTVHHRLNRGGDRALNKAIHTIATTRMRSDPKTQAYTLRRCAEGKTDREIRRCLKRYIARQLYRSLTTAMTPPPKPQNQRGLAPTEPWPHSTSHPPMVVCSTSSGWR